MNKLKAEPCAQSDFDNQVKSATIRLEDVKNLKLSPDSSFDLVYNACHALSLAALRWHGYRSENRYIVFQCLQHTLSLPPAKWRICSKAHDKRNLVEYDGEVFAETALLRDLLRVTEEIARKVLALPPIAAI